MKKKSLFISVVLLSVMWLTSCLEGNNKQTGIAYGVLTTSINYFTLVLNSTIQGIGPVSSPQLAEFFAAGQMELDKCYTFKYEIDVGIPENSYNAILAYGYATVTITEFSELSTYHVEPYLTDTATALENEIPVLNGFVASASAYAAGYMYVQQTVNQPEDQELEWRMSYDYNTIYNPTVVSGVRYYDLFVRAVKITEGTKSNTDVPYVNAYHMSNSYEQNFFEQIAESEKAYLGSNYDAYSSTFKFRIFYVTKINEGVLTWQNVSQEAYIALFVNEYE
jgi:hypothetical protein